MNREEKKLAEKVLSNFNSEAQAYPDFTREEHIIIERWRVHKIINEDAFINITSITDNHKRFLQTANYPFTSSGDKEIKRHWYLEFRNDKYIIIIRDILTAIAFFVSLYLALSKAFEN